jgi:predicted permease
MPGLKNQSTHLIGAPSATRFRVSLATTQIGLSMALLVMAGLFSRSLWNLGQIELGFDPANLVTFQLSPERSGYDAARSGALFERVREELAVTPGIGAVSVSTVPLLTGSNAVSRVTVDGVQADRDASISARYALIGPDYFRTLGVRLIAGREFTRADVGAAPAIAVVNEAFAERFELGQRVVGARLGLGDSAVPEIEIVGLVGNTKYSQAKQPAPPQFFLPYGQSEGIGGMTFYARTTQSPAIAMQTIHAAVARLDRTLPVESFMTMRDRVRANTAADRLTGTLSLISAALATFLAAIGLYGMLTYTVAQRTREIGVRMALGADRADVRRMFLGQVLRMVAAGGGAGIVIALALGRVAQSLLFGLESHDPTVIVAASATLAAITVGAGLRPACRASRIDPISALRFD